MCWSSEFTDVAVASKSDQSMLASLEKMSLRSNWWTAGLCGQQSLVMLRFVGRCPHWQNSSDGDVYAMAV